MKINFHFPKIRNFAPQNSTRHRNEKNYKVEVWIDGKPVHTFQGQLSHVRNPRLALTLAFRDILRLLYARGRLLPTHEELRTLATIRTLVNRLERQLLRKGAERKGEEREDYS